MIGILKKKFILVNMGLVTLVLLIVFVSICLFSYHGMKSDSMMVMERILNNKTDLSPPPFEIKERDPDRTNWLTPVFSVLVTKEGEILSLSKENVTVSQEVVEKVTEEVLESGKDEGMLLNIRLRFMTQQTQEGLKIAFADMGREIDSLQRLILALALMGAGGLLGFFIISLYLSGWVLRPVEKAWEQQRQFVADASHELKTPITVILANIGILLAHKEDSIMEHAKWLENTEAEAKRMKKLVEDLLFLAKSDAAQSEITKKEALNLSDALWSCILLFEPVAYEQGLLIKSDIEPDLWQHGDESQLKQLIHILLDNACKYSDEGKSILVRLFREAGEIRISVTSFGAPIPKDQLDLVFHRFYCTDDSRSLKQGGYGLGLSIASTIAENHQGQISVQSSLEQGTTFIVALPATK